MSQRLTPPPRLSWEEFGTAVRALLTDEQRAAIGVLHDRVPDGYSDGCAAHNEGTSCCVEAFTEERV